MKLKKKVVYLCPKCGQEINFDKRILNTGKKKEKGNSGRSYYSMKEYCVCGEPWIRNNLNPIGHCKNANCSYNVIQL